MSSPVPPPSPFVWTDFVRNKLKSLQFGSVQLTVLNGRVTVIETEKKTRDRISSPAPGRARQAGSEGPVLSP